jgi:hypothetical protein
MPPCGVDDDQDLLSGGHEADAMAITRIHPVRWSLRRQPAPEH